MTPKDLEDDLNLLLSSNFRKTTAKELWEDGLDYGEDESLGRTLEELSPALLPNGAHTGVRVSWHDPKDDSHNICLHFHFLDDSTPAPPDCVVRVLEVKFYKA